MEIKLLTSLLILIAAFGSAIWNIRVKETTENLQFVTLMVIPQFLIATILIFFVPLPTLEIFTILFLNSVVHTAYIIFLVYTYRHGFLTRVYPLAIGGATLLSLIWHLMLGFKNLTFYEYAGVLILTSSIIGFTFFGKEKKGNISIKSIFYAMLTSFLIFLYSTIDTYGIRAAHNAVSYISWLFFIKALYIFLPMLLLGKIKWQTVLNQKNYITAGLLAGFGYAVAAYAFVYNPTSIVLSLRSTTILFIFMLSRFILKEEISLREFKLTFGTFLGVLLILMSYV